MASNGKTVSRNPVLPYRAYGPKISMVQKKPKLQQLQLQNEEYCRKMWMELKIMFFSL